MSRDIKNRLALILHEDHSLVSSCDISCSTSTSLSSTSTVICSCLPTFQYFKPTPCCMSLPFWCEEEDEYFGDFWGIAIASRLHLHYITRIHSPQHPRITLHIQSLSDLSSPSRLHRLRSPTRTTTCRPLFSSFLSWFFPFLLFLLISLEISLNICSKFNI